MLQKLKDLKKKRGGKQTKNKTKQKQKQIPPTSRFKKKKLN